jgi:hypothetical protein
MLNFYPPFLCGVLAAILKMADILKIGQVHGARKERRITRTRTRIIIIIIIIRNGAKTISLQTLFGRLNYLFHNKYEDS